MTIRERIEAFVRQWPGRTQREIAVGIFGAPGGQERVNQYCALLVARKLIIQHGAGGQNDPFRYYAA